MLVGEKIILVELEYIFFRTHNLLHLIDLCLPIVVALEKPNIVYDCVNLNK